MPIAQWRLTIDGRPSSIEFEQTLRGRNILRIDGKTVIDERPFLPRSEWEFRLGNRKATIFSSGPGIQNYALEVEGFLAGTRVRSSVTWRERASQTLARPPRQLWSRAFEALSRAVRELQALVQTRKVFRLQRWKKALGPRGWLSLLVLVLLSAELS